MGTSRRGAAGSGSSHAASTASRASSIRGRAATLIIVAAVVVVGLHSYLHAHVTRTAPRRTGVRADRAAAAIGVAPANRARPQAHQRAHLASTRTDNSSRVPEAARSLEHAVEAARSLEPWDTNSGYRGKHRVYCMVPFVWPHDSGEKSEDVKKQLEKNLVKRGSYGAERHAEIMATWGQRCDAIEFFIDRPPGVPLIPNLPANVISINMSRFLDKTQDHGQDPRSAAIPEKNRYGKHIWEKMWRSWVWVREHRAHNFEWFVKVDDDCFLFPENIRWYVQARGWSPMDTHYFGHKLYHRSRGGVPYTLIAGATVVWSRATLEVAATQYSSMPEFVYNGPERGKCEDRPHASEEVSTAVCLLENGVIAEGARDERNREMILLFHASALLLNMKRPARGHRDEGWYWKNKPEFVPELHDCCSTRPISFHAMKVEGNLVTMDEFFYNPSSTNAGVNKIMNKKNDETFNRWLFDTRNNLTQLRTTPGHPYERATPARYLTWEFNSGNLNNQLISAAAAFDTARMLNRTVILPWEARVMQELKGGTLSRAWDKMFLGYEDGLWDLKALEKVYKFVFESDLARQEDPILEHVHDPICRLDVWNAQEVLPALSKLQERCTVINIGGSGGQLRFQEELNEHTFFSIFRPADYLTHAADSWLQSIDWKTASHKPHLAVHSRSFWESKRCGGAYKFCTDKVKTELSRRTLGGPNIAHPEVASVMCFTTPQAINLVLERSALDKEHRLVKCQSGTVCRPWLLASDGQTAGIIEEFATDYGAKQFSRHGYLHRSEYREGKVNTMTWKDLIQRLENSYLDLYLLSQGDVFLGNVYSTFSSSACKMREPGEPSNVCRLLTSGKPDTFIASLEKQGLPSGWKLPWEGNSDDARKVVAAANKKKGGIPCIED
eukprot:m.46544 g.46544  ORF g.46544 m.46544 type:complete len:896 (-) comp6779_c0_seq1:129-2816(-)